MIEWEVRDEGLRVFDSHSAELTVHSPDIDVNGDGAALPRPVDRTVECAATELRFPVAVVYAIALEGEESYELGNDTGPLELPDGRYVLDIDAEIKAYLLVDGPATVHKSADYSEVVVTFPTRQSVVAGFRSRHERPTETVTTPGTPEGLAATLSVLSSAHKTTSPDRSYPSLRGHPPLVETGGELSIPPAVESAVPDTGIELVVPPSLEQLFVLAPLAYYLQAEVAVEDRQPQLRAPEVGLTYDLDPSPLLERDAARTLRKVFFLDCLVRNAGPYGTTLAEASLLDALELDAASLYDGSPAERLATYLRVPFGAIDQRIPEWHLAMYVNPEAQHVATLPYLLDKMALIHRPRTSELDGSELVERSLDDFYRSDAGQVASVDIVKPDLRAGRIHGWLADGIPIDVFKSTPEAYQNRLSYLDRDRTETSIVVVLNDEEMSEEHADVEDIYRTRAEELPIDLEITHHLRTARLARTFESEHEFVHYIGHCEEEGLRCPDGYLSATSLDRVRTETFFLNACGSFHEGMELIARGSVAGAVTFSKVLNDHAVKVGSAFARLLVNGFGIERAMRLARRRIMMGKDYAVVGDGTHALIQSENPIPNSARLEEPTDGQYLLTYDQYTAQHTGGHYHPYVEGNEYAYLCGNESEFAMDRSEVVSFLERTAMPVVFDGTFYWSEELADRLDQGPV